MKTTVLIAFLAILLTLTSALSEHALDELLRRLEATESVTRHLLNQIEELETRDKDQQLLISKLLVRIEQLESREDSQEHVVQTLSGQISAQRQRVASLEGRVNQSSKVDIHTADDKKEEDRQGEEQRKKLPKTEKAPSRIRRAENEENVAFFATLSTHLEHAGNHQTFIFDHVVTNFGSGYNSHNGNFIAPVSGTYVFSTTLLSLYHQSSHSQFTKNGIPVSYMYVSGGEAGYDTTSQTIVIYMQKGDDICIKNIDADKSYHGYHYSSFSGFLLQQTYSAVAPVGRK